MGGLVFEIVVVSSVIYWVRSLLLFYPSPFRPHHFSAYSLVCV